MAEPADSEKSHLRRRPSGEETGRLPKPLWIRVRAPSGEAYERVKRIVRGKTLHTVCEEARCPNLAECWGRGTATFLLLGDVCTRNCGFCAVETGKPATVSPGFSEADAAADAVASMNLRHAVLTSVTRDDLPDGGAALFAETIARIRLRAPGCSVEALIPDFSGNRESLRTVIASKPHIIGHNLETVPRLYPSVRPQADYRRSLGVLKTSRELDSRILTKSGVMTGLGETRRELLEVMKDLREVDCDILTIGQYLRPSKDHLPVVRYCSPAEFEDLKDTGLSLGFKWVESGPLVRSSYRAEAQARGARVPAVERSD